METRIEEIFHFSLNPTIEKQNKSTYVIVNDKRAQPVAGSQGGVVESWGAEPPLKGLSAIQPHLLHGTVGLVWPSLSGFQYNLEIWISG